MALCGTSWQSKITELRHGQHLAGAYSSKIGCLTITIDIPCPHCRPAIFNIHIYGRCEQASDSQQAAGTMAAGIGQFLEDLLPDSFLRHAFGGFFRILDEAGPGAVRRELAVEAAALKEQLRSSLGLQFEVEDLEDNDEDGPVVVEL